MDRCCCERRSAWTQKIVIRTTYPKLRVNLEAGY